ncbi:MAG: hypothetical protein SGPRY_006755 [Prymnesium sp.]
MKHPGLEEPGPEPLEQGPAAHEGRREAPNVPMEHQAHTSLPHKPVGPHLCCCPTDSYISQCVLLKPPRLMVVPPKDC